MGPCWGEKYVEIKTWMWNWAVTIKELDVEPGVDRTLAVKYQCQAHPLRYPFIMATAIWSASCASSVCKAADPSRAGAKHH